MAGVFVYMKQKVRAQVKSRWYYIFWGLATIFVVWGQIYVGTGYRIMAKQMIELLNKVDGVLLYKSDDSYKNFL